MFENISGANIIGMGNVTMPGNPGAISDFSSQKVGSGDVPIGNIPKKRKFYKQKPNKFILNFDDFMQNLN